MSRMPEAGELVDDVFRIESKLDSGNFGAVYKAEDELEKRLIALKILKPGPHDENELRQRFEREARLVYSLRHPHIVQVYYYGETNSGLPYMAMEYLQGTDLRSLLVHHGPLAPALIRRISLETLSALESAHGLGIVHRDLKPANIFLVNDGGKGHVKVLDFGFAKALDDDRQGEITNAGTLVGTPAYMSPELVHKKNVGPPADIYAMGLIIAEMLTGEKLIQIESVYDTILFQASSKPIRLPEPIRTSIFGPIIEKAIAKSLDQRYRNADEMIADLKRLDIPGAGPVIEGPPRAIYAAPSEFGSADTEARTVPRSDGMPSLDEVDAALGLTASAREAAIEDAMTRDYSDVRARLASAGHPVLSSREPQVELGPPPADASDEPSFDSTMPASGHFPRPDDSFIIGTLDVPQPTQSIARNARLTDIVWGVVVGVVILGIFFAVLMLMGR
jgi:eukaryotic-like serine/threonine-protein kinase